MPAGDTNTRRAIPKKGETTPTKNNNKRPTAAKQRAKSNQTFPQHIEVYYNPLKKASFPPKESIWAMPHESRIANDGGSINYMQIII